LNIALSGRQVFWLAPLQSPSRSGSVRKRHHRLTVDFRLHRTGLQLREQLRLYTGFPFHFPKENHSGLIKELPGKLPEIFHTPGRGPVNKIN